MIAVQVAFASEAEARLALRPQHRERLAALLAEGVLIAAGPYADESGALLLFAADRADVEAAIADDPYYRADGVTVVSIADWSPVIGSIGSPLPVRHRRAGSSATWRCDTRTHAFGPHPLRRRPVLPGHAVLARR